MKWLKFSLPLLVMVLLVVSACGSARIPGTAMPTPAPAPTPSESNLKEGYASDADVPGGGTEERKIVRTGYITLEVKNVAETIDRIGGVVDEMGGYVVSSRKYEDETTSGSISIRVPVERFDDALKRLRQLAISVPDESTQSKDVTEEYVDLEARLRNLEATEAQYLALLEMAKTVEEMLKVQQALSNVRGQIEQIVGRMKYLERTSDMALIEIGLQGAKPLTSPWSPVNALKSAVRGLATFVKVLATVVIWLGVFCWVWIPILVIWLKRRRRKA